MLDHLFVQILNLSFTGGIVILFVLAVRLLLKRSPKVYSYLLWSAVLFRLLCPVSFKSALSLLPTRPAPVPQGIVSMAQPKISTGVSAIDSLVNAALPPAAPQASADPLQLWIFIGSLVWAAGTVSLLAYSVVTLVKLKARLRGAAPCGDNIYTSHRVHTAFVVGVLRPKIYLPAGLSPKERAYILLHEQLHIRRFDHIVKIVSFLALCLHWFNPLVWLAFFLSARDMEMSCDEAVIKRLGKDVKKAYAASLLTLATGRPTVGGTPLAFGEGDAKGRIKNVLHYKKPAFWTVTIAAAGVLYLAAGLMLDPKDAGPQAAGLWESRTREVRDHAAVESILSELSFPEKLRYDGVTLFTAGHPYGIEVKFKTDTETRNFYTGALNEGPFQQNAILLFSLIENAEHIIFTLDDGQAPYSVGQYTRDWAEDVMGGGRLFSRTETKSAFEALRAEVAATVGDRMEELVKHHQPWAAQTNLTFFVKPGEPAQVIAATAAEVWLKSFLAPEVPAESRISGYTVTDISVIAGEPRAGEKWEDMKYHYVVRVQYNITAATEDYFAPGDGVSGKGSFAGLFRELCVKAQKNGQFEIVSVGAGGGEQIFAPPGYSQGLTADELAQTEEIAQNYFTTEAPYYEGVVSIGLAPDDSPLYQNAGLQGTYEPGSIIVYQVLTGKDKREESPPRSISIARKTADSPWEIIGHGH